LNVEATFENAPQGAQPGGGFDDVEESRPARRSSVSARGMSCAISRYA
jgi:hypothetical protein